MAHKTHDTQHGLQTRAYLLQIRSRASLLLSSLAHSVVRSIFTCRLWRCWPIELTCYGDMFSYVCTVTEISVAHLRHTTPSTP